MKALIYTGPQALTYGDAPVPVAEPGELLIKVAAVGICGSDMHAYHGHDERRPPPLVLGHEAAGVIANGPRRGERVTVNPLVTCGRCEACIDGSSHLCLHRQIISMPPCPGAFAEYVTIPERNVLPIPDDMTFAVAALAEPLAVAWHAVRIGVEALHRPLPTAVCCVLGGGAIGLGAALVLDRFGAHDIRLGEPNPQRRATAAAAGPISAYAPGSAGEPPPGSVDLIIDAVGAAATRSAASRLAKPGGLIVHIGLLPGHDGFDIRRITLQEITVRGSYCYTVADFRDVVGALAQHGFGTLEWVQRMPLSRGPQAFKTLDRGDLPAAKIILEP
ncbi:alcohol dehydrogenase catalytic domain-containing protein [Acidiphilium sp. AL]|nr:alcohol dehydrogenase catalytic domain-containing protein [Acidiphilium sp. AL]MCU4161214.1 alcohol dehydrogenase catalytic domain-containing protein [Acidiphilium sp. AL]